MYYYLILLKPETHKNKRTNEKLKKQNLHNQNANAKQTQTQNTTQNSNPEKKLCIATKLQQQLNKKQNTHRVQTEKTNHKTTLQNQV